MRFQCLRQHGIPDPGLHLRDQSLQSGWRLPSGEHACLQSLLSDKSMQEYSHTLVSKQLPRVLLRLKDAISPALPEMRTI